jgi:hypothetical protein
MWKNEYHQTTLTNQQQYIKFTLTLCKSMSIQVQKLTKLIGPVKFTLNLNVAVQVGLLTTIFKCKRLLNC